MTDSLIAEIRRFNRFYTRRIGLLRQTLGQSEFTLPQARLLFEAGLADAPLSASDIAAGLDLDPAYLARLLKSLAAMGMLTASADPRDRRRKTLALTEAGRQALATLQAAADREAEAMIATLGGTDQNRLETALKTASRLMGATDQLTVPPIVTLRPHAIGDIGWVIERQSRLYAEEYGWNQDYEALVCEIGSRFLRDFKPGREACWIAERAGERIGAVFLVERSSTDGQLRMLHVEQSARGLGVGAALVRECIEGARRAGYAKLILWTNDVLHAARKLYQIAGFTLVSQDSHHSFGHDLHGQIWELPLVESR